MKPAPYDKINDLTPMGFDPIKTIGEENLEYPTQKEREEDPILER